MQAFTLLTLLLQPASVCHPRSLRVPSPSPRSMATAHLVQPGSHPRSTASDAYSPFMRPSHDRQSSKGQVTSSLLQTCTVPLSLFADPERILRRLYVFAEEPCKSTTTTSEPCSPVFKEVQPRPSGHSN